MTDTDQPRTLDFCSSSANSMEQEEGITLGERLKPLSSPAWTTHCPFLREGNGNIKPTGQGFCKWNSGLTGQLLQSEYAFLDHVETQKNRLFGHNSSLVKNASSFFV